MNAGHATEAAVRALRAARAEADTLRGQRNALGTVLVLLLLAVTLLLLTGCGGGGEPPAPDVPIKVPPCTVEPRPAICQ